MSATADTSERTELVALASELAATNALITRLIRELNSTMVDLCVTDREPPEILMRNFPVPGANRLIAHRSGEGGTFTLAQNTPLLILPSLETRLGISVINSGAGAVTLFLTADISAPGTNPLTQGSAQIFLAASGGAWDGRLGNVLWGGAVTANCAAVGGSTVVVATV